MLVAGAVVALSLAESRAQLPPSISAPRIIIERVDSGLNRAQADSIYTRLVKPELTVTRTKGALAGIVYSRRENTLVQQFSDGKALLWHLGDGTQCREFHVPPDSTVIAYDRAQAAAWLLNAQRLTIERARPDGTVAEEVLASGVRAVALGPAGDWLVAATAGGKVIGFALAAGTQQWSVDQPVGQVAQIAASQDGQVVSVLGRNGEIASIASDGRTLFKQSGVRRIAGFDRQGRLRFVRDRTLVTVSRAGQVADEKSLSTPTAVAIASPSGGTVLELDAAAKGTLRAAGARAPIDDDVAAVQFIDDTLYVYAKHNGVAYLRSVDKDFYLLSLIPSAEGWIVVDHEGRYDGTVEGSKDVVWKAGNDTLTLDQFFEEFFRPGLIADYVNGRQDDLGMIPVSVDKGIFLGPKIEIETPDPKMVAGKEFRIVTVGTSRGGDLAPHITVYHNGKRLPEKARLGSRVVKDDKQYLLVEVFAFTPTGGINEVWAEAKNVHGIASRSEVKKTIAEGGSTKGAIRIVGVGIDQYKDMNLRLDNAVGDAQSILRQLTTASAAQFSETKPLLVTNALATRRGIQDALSLLETASPEDSIVLALVGHGVVRGDEWYFLPQDVEVARLKESSISARALQDALVASPAKRILVVLDACNSGGSIDDFNRYRNFQRRFAQSMSRAAGVTVLAATRRDQLALEFRDLGHGIFTYMLLEGLRGAADTTPKDNLISAHEVVRYVGENLQRKARELLKAAGATVASIQEPVWFSIGSDFLLGRATQ